MRTKTGFNVNLSVEEYQLGRKRRTDRRLLMSKITNNKCFFHKVEIFSPQVFEIFALTQIRDFCNA